MERTAKTVLLFLVRNVHRLLISIKCLVVNAFRSGEFSPGRQEMHSSLCKSLHFTKKCTRVDKEEGFYLLKSKSVFQ